MAETKQGVAQRVMSEMRTKRERADRVGDYSQNTVQHEQLYGAKQMFAALSAEARAMIAKWKIPNVPEDLIYSQALHDMARRLGLDLEGDDS